MSDQAKKRLIRAWSDWSAPDQALFCLIRPESDAFLLGLFLIRNAVSFRFLTSIRPWFMPDQNFYTDIIYSINIVYFMFTFYVRIHTHMYTYFTLTNNLHTQIIYTHIYLHGLHTVLCIHFWIYKHEMFVVRTRLTTIWCVYSFCSIATRKFRLN